MDTASLGHVSTILPEVVLGTKEFNEKARVEAFECLVLMGTAIKEQALEASDAMEDSQSTRESRTPVEYLIQC